MTSEEYVEQLTFQDIDDLSTVIDPYATVRLRLKEETHPESIAAENVDHLINKAPVLSQPVTIYRKFSAEPDLRKGVEVLEPAFLFGTARKPSTTKDTVILEIEIPADIHALKLPGETYVLGRGLKLALTATETDLIPAKLKGK